MPISNPWTRRWKCSWVYVEIKKKFLSLNRAFSHSFNCTENFWWVIIFKHLFSQLTLLETIATFRFISRVGHHFFPSPKEINWIKYNYEVQHTWNKRDWRGDVSAILLLTVKKGCSWGLSCRPCVFGKKRVWLRHQCLWQPLKNCFCFTFLNRSGGAASAPVSVFVKNVLQSSRELLMPETIEQSEKLSQSNG